MTSQKEDILNSLRELKQSKIQRKNISVRSSTAAICAMVAKEFNAIIARRKICPNIKGEYIFAMRLNDVLKFVGKDKLTQNFRKIMREFGFSLHIFNREIQITRFSN